MLTKETQASIGQLFLSMIDNDSLIEPIRQQLNSKEDFDPFLLFKRLDSQNHKVITVENLFKFLKLHDINGNLNEIRFLIMTYDSDSSNAINYNQFLNMVLCQKYYSLKKPEGDYRHYLSYETEKAFAMLLQAELTLARNAIALLPKITQKEDFSVKRMMNDLKGMNYLLEEHFEEMMEQKWMDKERVSKEQLLALMKRLDITKNGKVTIEELEKFIYFPYTTAPIRKCYDGNRNANIIQEKSNKPIDKNERITSPMTNTNNKVNGKEYDNSNSNNNQYTSGHMNNNISSPKTNANAKVYNNNNITKQYANDKMKGNISTPKTKTNRNVYEKDYDNNNIYQYTNPNANSNANTNANTMGNINSNCNKAPIQQQKQNMFTERPQCKYHNNHKTYKTKVTNIMTSPLHNQLKTSQPTQEYYHCPTESYGMKSTNNFFRMDTQQNSMSPMQSNDCHPSLQYHRQLRSPDQARIKEREIMKYKASMTEPISPPVNIKDSINVYQKQREMKAQQNEGNHHNIRYQYQTMTTDQNIDRINQRIATSPSPVQLQDNPVYHHTRYISTIHNHTDMNKNEYLNDRLETIEMNPQSQCQYNNTVNNNNNERGNIHMTHNKQTQMTIPTPTPIQMQNQRAMPEDSKMPLRVSNTLNIRLSPERKSYNNDEYYNYKNNSSNTLPNDTNPSMNYDSNQQSHSLPNPQADLIAIWKQISINEKSIEDIKMHLASQPDFNIEDAFRIFETNQSNDQLSLSDIKIGYASFNLFPSTLQLQLLINRYDIDNKGYINYADFFDMLTPFKKSIRDDIEHRQPNHYRPSFNKTNVFNGITKNYIKRLLSVLVNTEFHLENLRKGINLSNEDVIKDLFGRMDKGSKGFLTPDDVECYMKENRIAFDQKDVDLLYIRLDKNRDGKIQYEEVALEFFSSL